MSTAPSSQAPDAQRRQILEPKSLRQIGVLLAYGLAFTALHHIAAIWATGALFSLWFPAAGLRFAFLWRVGARMTPAAALAELFVQLAFGESRLGPAPLMAVAGIVSPCLIYGLVIHFVRSRGPRHSTIIGHDPLPFALAAVLGPILACLAALPWAIPLALQSGPIYGPSLLHSLLVFALGDMLGVLIVAPPLVWLSERIAQGSEWKLPSAHPAMLVELLLATAAAWAIVWGINQAGMGIMLGPVLLATCWVGLRAGRTGAWLSILFAAVVILPMTSHETDDTLQLRLNMLLACIAAIGYLAGSFAEAETSSHAEIERRNRLLYQAERLKTLRAMSVAVIHEISQPLSTISIEANNLVAMSKMQILDRVEIASTSELILRKSQDLTQMIRRLRSFGNRAADPPSRLSIHALIEELAVLAGPEAKASKVHVDIQAGPDAWVLGQDVELRQVLLNLLRNAIAASPPAGRIDVRHEVSSDRVLVTIENDACPTAPRAGMGVGLIIARSIAAAHGGSIHEGHRGPQRFSFALDLPLTGAPA